MKVTFTCPFCDEQSRQFFDDGNEAIDGANCFLREHIIKHVGSIESTQRLRDVLNLMAGQIDARPFVTSARRKFETNRMQVHTLSGRVKRGDQS